MVGRVARCALGCFGMDGSLVDRVEVFGNGVLRLMFFDRIGWGLRLVLVGILKKLNIADYVVETIVQ